jgi:peptidoglycan/xylan/chitin deacetylase (PgdA/CDA1 family)
MKSSLSAGLRLKTAAARSLRNLGLFPLLRRISLGRRGFILMYHRIVVDPSLELFPMQPGMFVTLNTFRRHMAFLAGRFDILPLEELLARAHSGKSIGGCCAVTFDDGWKDNFDHAFPVLLEYRVPATIFLATGYIGTGRWFWPDEIAWHLTHGNLAEELVMPIMWRHTQGGTPDEIDEMIEQLKRSPDARKAILQDERFVAATEGDGRPRLLMDWREVRVLVRSGLISFGSHTVSHALLDQIEEEAVEREIDQSRQQIEEVTEKPCALFAYPNGKCTPEARTILQNRGFIGAVTTRRGWIDGRVEAFDLPRIGMHEDVSARLPLFHARILSRRF